MYPDAPKVYLNTDNPKTLENLPYFNPKKSVYRGGICYFNPSENRIAADQRSLGVYYPGGIIDDTLTLRDVLTDFSPDHTGIPRIITYQLSHACFAHLSRQLLSPSEFFTDILLVASASPTNEKYHHFIFNMIYSRIKLELYTTIKNEKNNSTKSSVQIIQLYIKFLGMLEVLSQIAVCHAENYLGEQEYTKSKVYGKYQSLIQDLYVLLQDILYKGCGEIYQYTIDQSLDLVSLLNILKGGGISYCKKYAQVSDRECDDMYNAIKKNNNRLGGKVFGFTGLPSTFYGLNYKHIADYSHALNFDAIQKEVREKIYSFLYSRLRQSGLHFNIMYHSLIAKRSGGTM